ncbi:MAG: MOSC N-terminal beta barrel domain-containing protein [Candidatus Thioglobus sp.]
MVEITDLYIYPVKSLRGIPVSSSLTSSRGFKYDREWMITDDDYFFVTQRQIEKMATISVLIDDDFLTLQSSKEHEHKISLKKQSEDIVNVTVWNDVCGAIDEGDEVSYWLTKVLGGYNKKPLRLVRFAEFHRRKVPSKYLYEEEAESAFSDQFPYLIVSWSSLNVLNSELECAGQSNIDISRFRPNIVVKGVEDIEKKQPQNLYSINKKYFFGLRKPCKRCKITTIDQTTGQIANPNEPLATLTKLRFSSKKEGAFFGQNATFSDSNSALISVGDKFKMGV